jgi:hypothetical protein
MAVLAEEVATVNKLLSEALPSLKALRHALEATNLGFEDAYPDYFVGQDCETIRTALNLKAQSLLRLAENLKHSA